ncbi:protocatechuate dioxygenase, partial [Actinomadura darangshiensis]
MADGGNQERRGVSRRAALTAMGGAGLGAVGAVAGGVALADGADGKTGIPVADVANGTKPACVLSPETTEGPYYLDYEMVRRDVTEDRPGIPMMLRVAVVDTSAGCRPVKRAAVDIWHCDAGGVYS